MSDYVTQLGFRVFTEVNDIGQYCHHVMNPKGCIKRTFRYWEDAVRWADSIKPQ